MKKCSLLILILIVTCTAANAQELIAKVTVQSQRVANNIDKKIFTTLQNQLTNFLNTRKWTNDVFAPSEKINCFFLLTIESASDQNVFEGTLTVKAARPVFNAA